MKTLSYFMVLSKPRENPGSGLRIVNGLVWLSIVAALVFGAKIAFSDAVKQPGELSRDPKSASLIEGDDWEKIDLYQDFDSSYGEPEDFKAVRDQLRKEDELRKVQPVSEDAKASEELKVLKDAEKVRAEQLAIFRKLEIDRQNGELRARRSSQKQALESLKSGVRKDVGALPGVTDEELGWDGLE